MTIGLIVLITCCVVIHPLGWYWYLKGYGIYEYVGYMLVLASAGIILTVGIMTDNQNKAKGFPVKPEATNTISETPTPLTKTITIKSSSANIVIEVQP